MQKHLTSGRQSPPPYYIARLRAEFDRRLKRNRRYSLRAFARSLSLDPGLLCRVLAGQQVPRGRNVLKLVDRLALSPKEKDQFVQSLDHIRARKKVQNMGFELRDPKPAPLAPTAYIENEKFELISEWHHAAILELTYLPSFKEDPAWIGKILGISKTQAKRALERLCDLNLVQRLPNGKLRKVDMVLTTRDPQFTSSALRHRQNKILAKSIEALRDEPIDRRVHASMTMAIDPALIPEARRRIAEFQAELCSFLESGHREEVMELQVSLFSLQRKDRRNEKGKKSRAPGFVGDCF